jgi:hypothetical protein
MPNAGAIAARPAESVTANVTFKNDVLIPGRPPVEFTVYWSYAANPFWHVEVRQCVNPGDVFDTKVVYNHIKEGPQIKFGAAFRCFIPGAHKTVAFHSMIFDPSAHFHARYRAEYNFTTEHFRFELCAHGGGNNEVCHGDIR